MTSTIPRFPACSIPGCHIDEHAVPGRRIFHGDPDPIFNDAPPTSYLCVGDQLHDGCAVYTWAGHEWRLVIGSSRIAETGRSGQLL